MDFHYVIVGFNSRNNLVLFHEGLIEETVEIKLRRLDAHVVEGT